MTPSTVPAPPAAETATWVETEYTLPNFAIRLLSARIKRAGEEVLRVGLKRALFVKRGVAIELRVWHDPLYSPTMTDLSWWKVRHP